MAKILVVEDEFDLSECLRQLLTREGHQVEVVDDGTVADNHLKLYDCDVLLLDINLPGISGMEICRRYRSRGGKALILMLTARSSIDDKSSGLDAGADDYLDKPFHVKELLARIRALLRRNLPERSDVLQAGPVSVDTASGEVVCNGAAVRLLPKEVDVLTFLMRHKGRAFTAEDILRRVWTCDSAVSVDTVRTHIKNLRRKLELCGCTALVRHERGFGYSIELLHV